ncbi:MAG TPA: discoidin domain-containing protein, partial [Armatimonadota bacterium]|nr:discoidin domain-containing protein [Armatimonadota bacterium]
MRTHSAVHPAHALTLRTGMAVALVFTLQLPLRAQHRAPNVALASLGASAEASSQFDPVLSPANAINGTWHTWASSWSSGHGMPQWLTVTLKQPQTVQAVRIHADERPELRFELRDYTVDVRPPGTAEWRTVARVTGNTAAHRLDAFPPVQAEAVRLTVTATGGGDDVVRMNEIEVFGLGELPETQTAFAVGAIDGQYSEFAIAGDYAQFAERFPDDVTVDLA